MLVDYIVCIIGVAVALFMLVAVFYQMRQRAIAVAATQLPEGVTFGAAASPAASSSTTPNWYATTTAVV